MGRRSSGTVGPRLLVGLTLDVALASFQGHAQAEEGKWSRGLCGRIVSGADEERGCRPGLGTETILNGGVHCSDKRPCFLRGYAPPLC